MKRAPTDNCAPGSSPKLKSLQDLSVRIKTKVVDEAVDDVSLGVDGRAQHHLNSHVLLHHVLYPSNPFHYPLCLVCPIADIPLKRVIPAGVVCRGGGPCSVAKPGEP
jgi:hypothetical protein